MSKAASTLPRSVWLPLGPSLAWLTFGEYREISDIEGWAASTSYLTETDIEKSLRDQWQQLADYASRNRIQIRARRGFSGPEFELTDDELRNYRHISWNGAGDLLTRRERTWSGDFADAVERDEGLALPRVGREDLTNYKKVAHLYRPPIAVPDNHYEMAQGWLREKLNQLPRRPGWKASVVREMRAIFPMPEYKANGIWRDEAERRDWPRRGRPKKISE